MLQPRPPARAVELLERREDTGGDERPLLGVAAREYIEGEWVAAIPGVKQDHVVRPVPRDRRDESFGKIAMRINESHAAPGGNVGSDELLEQRGFAHAGLAKDGKVPATVIRENAETLAPAAEERRAEYREF